MELKKVTLEDQKIIEYYLKMADYPNCELTFTNVLVWSREYPVRYGIIEDHLVFYSLRSEAFTFPLGNHDVKPALDALMKRCKEQGKPFCLYGINEDMWMRLQTLYPNQLQIVWERDFADYIYRRSDLAELKGKKYHGKRNHINNFLKQNQWSYEPITEENRAECFEMCEKWWELNQDETRGKEVELSITRMELNLMKELGLSGGLIRVDGEVVAFTLGEAANHNTFVVHIEKALAQVQGAYPMINQQFILHEAMEYDYINREDDTGVPGLRKAKLSYGPAMLLKKGYVTQKEDTKELYKTIFTEDSASFVDYYYNRQRSDQKILTKKINEEIVAMLHMNPYELMMDGKATTCYYIVAVATKEEHRKQGYMRELMEQAFEIAQEEDVPYLYLMPANPDYYKGFGFEFITEPMRPQIIVSHEDWEQWRQSQTRTLFIEKDHREKLTKELLEQMVQFASDYLKQRYDWYTCPSLTHYEDLLEQAFSENGGLYIQFKDQDEIERFGYYFVGEEIEVFEQLGDTDFTDRKDVPGIMVKAISKENNAIEKKRVHINELV